MAAGDITVKGVAANAQGNAGTHTVLWSDAGGASNGDLALVFWEHNTTLNETTTPTSQGFTFVDSITDGSSVLLCYKRKCNGSESGSITCAKATASRQKVGLIIIPGGFDIAAYDMVADAGTNNVHTPPAVAAPYHACGALIVGAEHDSNSTTTATPPSGYTEVYEESLFGSGGSFLYMAYKGSAGLFDKLTIGSTETPGDIIYNASSPSAPTMTLIISPTLTVTAPTAIASGEGSGSPTISQTSGAQTLSPYGIGSGEAFGSPSLTPRVTVTPEAIRSSSGAVNYFTDPSFELGISQMITPVGCTLSQDATESRFGTKSLKYTALANDVGYYSYYTGAPAEAGQVWTGGFWVKPPRNIFAQAFIAAYSGGSLLTQQGGNVLALADVWTWIESAPLTMPATTDTVTIVPVINATNVIAGEVSYVDGVVLEKGTTVNMKDDPFSWMGTPTLNYLTSLVPTAIGSAEAFGTPVLSPRVTLAPTGFSDVSAVGTPVLSPRITLVPTSFDDGSAFGSPTLNPRVTLTPTSFDDGSALGSPVLKVNIPVGPTGVASAQAFGAPVVTTRIVLTPTGFDDGSALGSPAVTTRIVISPNQINSAEALGNPSLTPRVSIIPNAIQSSEAFGNPVLSSIIALGPTGIASLEALGVPVLSLRTTVSPNGFDDMSAVGTPNLGGGITLGPTAVASQEALGAPLVAPRVIVAPVAVASAEGIGTPALAPRITVSPNQIVSLEAVGQPTLLARISLTPTGIISAQAFGTPVITTKIVVSPNQIAGLEALGSPVLAPRIAVAPWGVVGTFDNLMQGTNTIYGPSRFNGWDTYKQLDKSVGKLVKLTIEIKVSIVSPIIVYPYQNNGISISNQYTVNPTVADTWEEYTIYTTVTDWGDAGPAYTRGSIGVYDTVNAGQLLQIRNLSISEVFSQPTLNPRVSIIPLAIQSSQAFGTPVIATRIVMTPNGVVSAQTFGATVITTILTLSPDGFDDGWAVGEPSILEIFPEFTGWGIPL